MKYTAVLMLFLGALSLTEARKTTDLVQVIEANGMTAVVESESESDSEDELLGVSAAVKKDHDEMVWEMDRFSRTFEMGCYKHALELAGSLGVKPPRVHTWELYDKAFAFPRVRRFDDVQENMNMLEHFQDNLNTNISNLKHVENFIRVGKTVQANINEKYHDGEFADPAGFDPRNPPAVTWSNVDVGVDHHFVE